jgi:hypothetical protein
MFSRWFYDSNYQRCRPYNNHIENFVYFRFLRDCRRLCPVIRQKKNEKIGKLYLFLKQKRHFLVFSYSSCI